MIDLTLNEHKLLARLEQEGLLPYEAIDGLALDRLVMFGLASVLDVFAADEVSFTWGGDIAVDTRQQDPLEMTPRRAVKITDRGRKELHLRG